MALKLQKFSHESLQDCETVVTYLEAFAEGFAQGSLSLSSDANEVVLEPRGLLRLRVRAFRGTYRSRLVLKVSWREGEGVDTEADPLRISPTPVGNGPPKTRRRAEPKTRPGKPARGSRPTRRSKSS